MNWQPIETAPLDGERLIILTWEGVFIAYYDTIYECFCENHYDNLWHKPTHWQPLPSPPPTEEK